MQKSFFILVFLGLALGVLACGEENKEDDKDGGPDTASGDVDGDSDGDADGDTDGDSDGDADGDTDGDSDGDSDGDTDSDTDTDTDTDSDTSPVCVDSDGDGYGANCTDGPDCDDTDDSVHEILNVYRDGDGDTYGAGDPLRLCVGADLPAGYVDNNTDCNDTDENVFQNLPGYVDGDGDSYGAGTEELVCTGATLPEGYVADNTDCDDTSATVYQLLDGYVDADGDEHGADGATLEQACSGAQLVSGYSTVADDCDDLDPREWDNCDESCVDEDGDHNFTGCDNYHFVPGEDCFDDPDAGTDASPADSRYPGAFEISDDGIDQDCDGKDLLASNDAGVFVAPPATGSDANPGTWQLPVATITKGVKIAEAASPTKKVYVGNGGFSESVETSVSMYGGFVVDTVNGWYRTTMGDSAIYGQKAWTLRVETGDIVIDGFYIYGNHTANTEVVHVAGANVDLTNDYIYGGDDSRSPISNTMTVSSRSVSVENGDLTLIDVYARSGSATITSSGSTVYSDNPDFSAHNSVVFLRNSAARIIDSDLDGYESYIRFYGAGGGNVRTESFGLYLNNSTADLLYSPKTAAAGESFAVMGYSQIPDGTDPADITLRAYSTGIALRDSSLNMNQSRAVGGFTFAGAWLDPDSYEGISDHFERNLDVLASAVGIDQTGPGQTVAMNSTIDVMSGASVSVYVYTNNRKKAPGYPDYANTGRVDAKSYTTGVRASGPATHTFLDNSIVSYSARGNIYLNASAGDNSLSTQAIGVDINGSGRRTFGDNEIEGHGYGGGIHAWVYAPADAGTPSVLTSVEVTGMKLAGGQALLDSNYVSATYPKAYAHGVDAKSVTAEAEARSVVLEGGETLVVNNVFQGAMVYVGATGTDNVSTKARGEVRGVLLGGDGDTALINNTIVGAYADIEVSGNVDGGVEDTFSVVGVDVDGHQALLVNNIIAAFNGVLDGGVSHVVEAAAGDVTLLANDLWGELFDCLIYDGTNCVDTVSGVNACGWDLCSDASGNISADPEMEALHLKKNSPCIDQGIDPTAQGYTLTVDIDDEARPHHSGYDIGHDEYYDAGI